MQPLPPSPAFTQILAWSMNIASHAQKSRRPAVASGGYLWIFL
jgi:hypothetical protein